MEDAAARNAASGELSTRPHASFYRTLGQLVAADGADERFLNARADKIAEFDDLLISMSGNRHDGSPIRVISDKEFGE